MFKRCCGERSCCFGEEIVVIERRFQTPWLVSRALATPRDVLLPAFLSSVSQSSLQKQKVASLLHRKTELAKSLLPTPTLPFSHQPWLMYGQCFAQSVQLGAQQLRNLGSRLNSLPKLLYHRLGESARRVTSQFEKSLSGSELKENRNRRNALMRIPHLRKP